MQTNLNITVTNELKLENRKYTCLGEDFEATGQSGQLQSWTEREAKVTAKDAWTVETKRLQKSKERFGKTFLINRNSVVHDITPNKTRLIIESSIYSSVSSFYFKIRNQKYQLFFHNAKGN